MEKYYPIGIIGGGISGVSFAHFAEKFYQQKGIIFETNDKLGGCIDTYSSPKIDDFWLELGAHTIYNSYEYFIQFLQDNKILDEIHERNKNPFKIFTQKNNITSFFKQVNLLRAALGLPLSKLITKNNKTISEYFRIVFGKNNYEQILRYCFDAILCQDSRFFPSDFLFKKQTKNKKLPRSFTFKHGISSLFTNLSNKKFSVSLSNEVKQIVKQENGWKIKNSMGTIKIGKLILATPWHITKKFLTQINHPIIINMQNQPNISKFSTVALVLDKNKLKHIKPLNGMIGIKQEFFSMVTRDVIYHKKFRGMTIHFKTEIKSYDLINKFLSNLNISNDAVIDVCHKINVVPCYQANHQIFLKQIKTELNNNKNLGITGNYFTRLAIEDCVTQSLKETHRLFKHAQL